MKKFLFCGLLLLLGKVQAQQYTLNGSASQINCHCYRLTHDAFNLSGSVWNNNKINLNQSFDFTFDVMLGRHNSPGADGIAFVLQPISTSVGTTGGGMGYEGILTSVGVTLDTYYNSGYSDPLNDHIAIQINGNIDHLSASNVAGPVDISASSGDVEDGQSHTLRIVWNAATQNITAYFDGVFRVSKAMDYIGTVFGTPNVYWGFTGATGGESNEQTFCTSLNPAFHFSPTQKRCINENVQFINGTTSFATIASFSWDFGDLSPVNTTDLNPVHAYTAAGDYTVKQTVTGADGCIETNTQIVRIGSKPVAGWRYNGDNCENLPIQFIDTSKVTVGTVNQWYWDLDNSGLTSTAPDPTSTYANYGTKNIKLWVKTLEGCESDTLYKPLYVHARSVADFTFTDSVCLGSPTFFYDQSTLADGPINFWGWYFGDTADVAHTQNAVHIFLTPGIHSVMLVTANNTTNSGSCLGIKQKTVFVLDKPVAALKHGPICEGVAITLQDSSYNIDGSPVTNWWWDLGNGQFSTQKDPVVAYAIPGPVTIRHAAGNSHGCMSDTITQLINVNAKPIAKFGYSGMLCSNNAVLFSDSSSTAGGSITGWFWLFDNGTTSTQKNSSKIFSPGNHWAKLVVKNNSGCESDTAFKSFFINAKADLSFSFNDTCKNSPASFSASSLSAIDKWHWSFGDGGVSSQQNPQHIYSTNNIYHVSLYAESLSGCNSDTLHRDIVIYGTDAFSGNDTIAAAGQPVQLHASGGTNYLWSPAGLLNNANIADPIATLASTQIFTVKAFTPGGCESYASVTVKIYKGPDIYLPTAFTPNRDGLNDVLRGIPVGITTFNYLKVYNRWGKEVFSTTDCRLGWDGKWQGQLQEQGAYVVMARGVDFKGNVITKRQTVILLP